MRNIRSTGAGNFPKGIDKKVDGRFNPRTKDRTPSIKDSDIKELINKYPST